MAYLGNRPAESFASFEKQVFTIVNSQTAYTLSHSVVNENDIIDKIAISTDPRDIR